MREHHDHEINLILGDCEQVVSYMPPNHFQCVVTSPPYWGLRDYGKRNQIGMEPTPDAYVKRLVSVFHEIYRVLRFDGTLWLNIGDSYANDSKWGGQSGGKNNLSKDGGYQGQRRKLNSGLRPKELCGIPWRLALALQSDGWFLRSDIIWAKPNPIPENVVDRPTRSHEYLFLLTKSPKYYYDAIAIAEPLTWDIVHKSRKTAPRFGGANKHKESNLRIHSGREYCGTKSGKRNKRDVWTIPLQGYKGAHFATFPEKLVTPCVLAGSKCGDRVLDPFMGSGTVGLVCRRLWREFTGIELNQKYLPLARKRIYG